MSKILGILFGIFAIGQTVSGQGVTDMAGTLTLYDVPFTWIYNNPRLRLGLEYHTHQNTAYSLEIGIGNKHLNHNQLKQSIWGQAYSFFEIRSEIKWFKQTEKKFATYLGVELFYYNMTDHLSDETYYVDRNGTEIMYEEADFKKEKYAIQAKAGIKFLATKRFVFDFYSGMGLAYRNIRYSNIVNPGIAEENDTFNYWIESYKNAGPYVLFQFSPGVRIGMLIFRP